MTLPTISQSSFRETNIFTRTRTIAMLYFLAGTALPYANLRLLSHSVWKYLYPFWPVQVRKKKGRKEGRKEEKSQEVYILSMRGATPSGRIPTKLGKCVRLTDVIKFA